jgi:hypothetical protein
MVPRIGAARAGLAIAAIVAASAPLCGCHLMAAWMFSPSTYTPGTLTATSSAGLARSSHALRTVGSVEVAVDLVQESERTVLEWRMGNGGSAPVSTDLSALAVTARDADGSSSRVALVDPAHEIGPRPLAPRRAALERIALHVPPSATRVCVAMTGAVASGMQPPDAACFTREEHGGEASTWQVEGGSP